MNFSEPMAEVSPRIDLHVLQAGVRNAADWGFNNTCPFTSGLQAVRLASSKRMHIFKYYLTRLTLSSIWLIMMIGSSVTICVTIFGWRYMCFWKWSRIQTALKTLTRHSLSQAPTRIIGSVQAEKHSRCPWNQILRLLQNIKMATNTLEEGDCHSATRERLRNESYMVLLDGNNASYQLALETLSGPKKRGFDKAFLRLAGSLFGQSMHKYHNVCLGHTPYSETL